MIRVPVSYPTPQPHTSPPPYGPSARLITYSKIMPARPRLHRLTAVQPRTLARAQGRASYLRLYLPERAQARRRSVRLDPWVEYGSEAHGCNPCTSSDSSGQVVPAQLKKNFECFPHPRRGGSPSDQIKTLKCRCLEAESHSWRLNGPTSVTSWGRWGQGLA